MAQQSSLNVNCSQPKFACGECETNLQNDFNDLMVKYAGGLDSKQRWSEVDGKKTIDASKKIDDFIKDAMQVMKKNNTRGNNKLNMILIGNSESLHETKAGEPRVAIKSPDGEFWLTFNTDPNAKGGQSVEIMRWDGKSAQYKFQELTFGKDGKPGSMDLTGQKCVRCHREPMRPNWDTYRAWSNVIPPRDDLVESGKNNGLDIAGRSYMNIMNRIAEDKSKGLASRFSLLDVPGMGTDSENISNMMSSVRSKGFFRVPHYPPKNELKNFSQKTAHLAGSSHLGFDQLTGQNVCMITNNLKKHKNFYKFKYALAGILKCNGRPKEIDWNNFKGYFSDSTQKAAFDYFKKADSLNLRVGNVRPSSSDDVLESIYKHTTRSHDQVNQAKDLRSAKMFEVYSALSDVGGGSKEIAEFLKKQTNVPAPYTVIGDPGGVKSVTESDPGAIAALRYLLEPSGVNVGSWSMVNGHTVADGTYSFSDQLIDMMQEQDIFDTIYKETLGKNKTEKCENLKKLSQQNLKIDNNSDSVLTDSDGLAVTASDGQPILVGSPNKKSNDYLSSICSQGKSEDEIIASRIKRDLSSSCMDCHSYQNTHVEDLFSSEKVARDRATTKTPTSPSTATHALKMLREGRMPPNGFGVGSNAEETKKNDNDRRLALSRYIEYISGQRAGICEDDTAAVDKPNSKAGGINK